MSRKVMAAILAHREVAPLLSDEHFSVDGTLVKLCFIGHALMENRSGLFVQGDLTQADGHAERRAALDMLTLTSRGRHG